MAGEDEKTKVLRGDQETINREIEKAKEQKACLIMIRGPLQGQRFFITQQEMTIGRDAAAEIHVNDPSISRKHATIRLEEAKAKLKDLGSSNGTYVNGFKVQSGATVGLAKEDMIRLGNSIFKFLPAGELETLYFGALGSAVHTDPLTQIYNKGFLMEALDAEFKRARGLQSDLSLIFFDIDHFKKVNDTYGHDAGDFVLKEVCQVVRTSNVLGAKDVFARYGGEEFVLLLSNTKGENAAKKAEDLRQALQMHVFKYEQKRIPVTSSFGVAELQATTLTGQSLLKAADKALYRAKQEGRNRVVISTD
jgi:diguanylate cyclase (GGDEF)-like protein